MVIAVAIIQTQLYTDITLCIQSSVSTDFTSLEKYSEGQILGHVSVLGAMLPEHFFFMFVFKSVCNQTLLHPWWNSMLF